MGGTEVAAFLSALAVEQRVSASTQNQALVAVLFLIRLVRLLLGHAAIRGAKSAKSPWVNLWLGKILSA